MAEYEKISIYPGEYDTKKMKRLYKYLEQEGIQFIYNAEC